MSRLYIAVGLPASGKDYYFKENFKDYEVLHISSDNIREKVFGDVNDQTHHKEVFKLMEDEMINGIKMGVDIYYNATNLSSRRRKNLIEVARNAKVDMVTIILFVPRYETCLERNKKRDRVVPEEAMKRMIKNFEPPHKSEGWDNMIIIGEKGQPNNYCYDILEEAQSISHDNPHHTLTIGEHMLVAESKYIFDGHKKDNIYYALGLHDIGKPFCKVFTNYKGDKPTDVAHYYCHENVGAYFWLSGMYGMVEIENYLYIANLIFNHMKFYAGPQALEKVRLKYGDEFFKDLKTLHYYDEKSH